IGYGSRFLRGLCLATPFLATDFLAVGVFQACGMGRKSLVFAVMRKIVLEIPALYLLNMLFPLYGLAYAQTVAEITLAAVAVIVLIRMFHGLKKQTTERGEAL
ncbi:MAG: MATE family efflux transporter, partial [Acetatifactor sp.]|nr:MATE family efflux transporter [Acetatifactor sp.]